MREDMDMEDGRYLVALKRIRGQIAEGSELSYYDDTAMGSKDTSEKAIRPKFPQEEV